MTYSPKVSIVIPVYNGSNYLREAIQSALKQTYKNCEVIVVNDGSNDDGKTEKIALSFGNRIRYFSKPNGGCGSALNLGIQKMQGDLFSWLSHDDLYRPKKIERQVQKYLTQVNPGTIIFSGFTVADANLHKIHTVLPPRTLAPNLLGKPLYPLLRGLIHGCTLLIPKHLFEEIDFFNEKLRTTQDYALWFEFFRRVPLIYDDHVNVIARIHSEQDTKKINVLHLQEGNVLWRGFAEQLSVSEKAHLAGSELRFLDELATYLSITPFEAAKISIQETAQNCVQKISVSVILVISGNTINYDDIKYSLASVFEQTHQNIELWIVCKEKIAFPWIADLLRQHPSPIPTRSMLDETKSLNQLVEKCIADAGGKYTAFLLQTDRFMPDKLEKQIWDLETNSANFAHCGFAIDVLENEDQSQSYHPSSNLTFPAVLQANSICLSSLIAHTSALQNMSSFPHFGEDWNARILIWMACHFPLSFLPETLVQSKSITTLARLSEPLINNGAVRNLLSSPEFFDHFRTLTFQEGLQSPIPTFEQYISRLKPVTPNGALDLSVFIFTAPLVIVKKNLQTYADYEGAIVRQIKHLVPTTIWMMSTKIYRVLRNTFLWFFKILGGYRFADYLKEQIRSYRLSQEENRT